MDYTELPPPYSRLIWPELPDVTFEDQTQSADLELDSRYRKVGRFVRQHYRGIAAASMLLTAASITANYEIESHTAVPNDVISLPSDEVPNILDSPSIVVAPVEPTSSNSQSTNEVATSSSAAVETSASPKTLPTQKIPPTTSLKPMVTPPVVKDTAPKHEEPVPIPILEGSAPQQLIIPRLKINTAILPVDSTVEPGEKNNMHGPVYSRINFPVDEDARYWLEGGLPNTIKNPDINTQQKDLLRTIIYGHASDIGNNLLFQNLEQLRIGDTFTLYTDEDAFTYTVYSESNPSKDDLANDKQVYNYPANGRKEAALVACLPNSNSHSVRIGYLSKVVELNTSNK